MNSPVLSHTFNYTIEYFKDGVINADKSHFMAINLNFGWSPKKENKLVFTVFGDVSGSYVSQQLIKFLEVKQQFGVENIINNVDSYKILEQCSYILFDSLIKVMEIRLPWFKSAYHFAPLDEVKLRKDLEV